MERLYSIMTGVCVGLSAYLAPMKDVFWCMLFFVLIDLIVGVIASKKNGIGCSSRRARESVLKLFCYLGATMMAYVAEKVFAGEASLSYKLVGGFICLVEFISIMENMATITGNPIFLMIAKLIRGTKGDVVKEILEEKNRSATKSK